MGDENEVVEGAWERLPLRRGLDEFAVWDWSSGELDLVSDEDL